MAPSCNRSIGAHSNEPDGEPPWSSARTTYTDSDGRLLQVEEIWYTEAERDPDQPAGHDPAGHDLDVGVDFVRATAESIDEVWSKLRRQAELADVRRRGHTGYQPAVQAS